MLCCSTPAVGSAQGEVGNSWPDPVELCSSSWSLELFAGEVWVGLSLQVVVQMPGDGV